MNFPEIGALNRRITLQRIETVVKPDAQFANRVQTEFTVWGRIESVGSLIFWQTSQINSGITHRIFIRSVKGKTDAFAFKNISWASSEGLRYKIKRVFDLNASQRFTVLEVEADGVNKWV